MAITQKGISLKAKDTANAKDIVSAILTDTTKEKSKFKVVSNRNGEATIEGQLEFSTKTKADAFDVKIKDKVEVKDAKRD